jgi:hypothetical protein
MKKKSILIFFLLAFMYGRSANHSIAATGSFADSVPVVKITTPQPGDYFKYYHSIKVEADAYDSDGKIAWVEFFYEGHSVGRDTVAPYTINFYPFSASDNAVIKTVATDDQGLKGSDSVTVVVAYNKPPVVKIVYPSAGTVIKVNDLITIDAAVSDPDGKVVKVDFYVDGKALSSDTSAPYTATWKATEGATEIKVVAYDEEQTFTSTQLTVIASKPDLFIKIKNPASESQHTKGDLISIEAQVFSLQKEVEVAFYVNEQLIGTDSTLPYTVDWISEAGVLMIKAVAAANTKKATDSVFIKVNDPGQNQRPVVRISDFYNGSIYYEGNVIGVPANASDADGTVTAVDFFVNGEFVATDSTAPYLLRWKATKGIARITAQAIDNRGAKSKLSNVYNTYTHNNIGSPIKIIEPINGSVYKTGSTVVIEAYTNARNSPHYTVRSPIEIYVNNVLIEIAGSYPYRAEWIAQKGKAVIKVKTTNFMDLLSDSVTIFVSDTNVNRLPVVNITTPQHGSIVDPGTTTTIRAHAEDSDDGISAVDFYVNGMLVARDSLVPYETTWMATSGTATIKAVARDNQGGESIDSTMVKVIQNTAPSIHITAPYDGQVIADGSNAVFIETEAFDSVGTISRVQFFVNGVFLSEDTEAPYVASWMLENGDAVIKAIATDDKGLQDEDSVTIHVKVTNPNSVKINLKSPLGSTVYTLGDVINLEAEVTKIDTVKVDYVEFQINDTLSIRDSVAPYLSAWTPSHTGLVIIEAFPIRVNADGSTTPLAMDTDTIFIKKGVFEVKLIQPENSNSPTYYAGTIVPLKAIAADAQYSISKIEFFVDGDLVGTATAYPYTAEWRAKKGTAMVVAIATNSVGNTVADTAIIKVEEGFLETEILSPFHTQQFKAGDTVNIITVVRLDQMESPVCNVEFFVNGVSIGMQSKRPSTGYFSMKWKATKGYSIIKVVAWTNSGLGYSVATVVVNVIESTSNLPPTVAIVNPLNGSSFKPGDNIAIEANASDADGSVVYVSFFEGNNLIGIDSISPYTQNWSTLTEGTVKLTATATDNLAAVGVSTPVEVTISTTSGIASEEADKWIFLYPNPVSQVLNIEVNENAAFELLAADGKRVVMKGSLKAGQKHSMNIGHIARGSYVVRIYNEKMVSFKKIIINP